MHLKKPLVLHCVLMSSAQLAASLPEVPDTSPDHLVEAKRKRNIVVGSVVGGIVVLVVVAVLVYVLVFHPRVYYGNHVMITTLQKPGSCTTSKMAHDEKTPLPLSYNCPALASTPQNFMQSAPMSRFTLVNRTTTPNDIASCDQNSQVMCMLVSAKLERQGLIHEQQSFMVWEPLANMYLYLNDCAKYTDTNVCKGSAMGKHFNICEVYPPPTSKTYNTSTSICTLNGRSTASAPQLVFRPLPKDFQKLMADTKTNPYMKGFLFHFESTKPTNNMLTIKTNYIMRSDLSNDVVHFNVVTGNIDMIDDKKKTITDPNDKTKVDETFYWQIIK